MASIQFPGFNSVPQGVAGTGDAVIFQGGDKPLNTLMRLDAAAQRNAQRNAQLKAKQEQDDLRNFTAGIKLDTKDFLPYNRYLSEKRAAIYPQLSGLYQNPGTTSIDKRAQGQKITDDYNALVARSNELEGRVKSLTQVASDKRYVKADVVTALNNSFKDQNGNLIPLEDFEPENLDRVLENPDLFNIGEVASQYVDNVFQKESQTIASAARPGGTGRLTAFESNLFLPNAKGDGPLRDPITNKPILKVGPEAVAAADDDPFMKRILDKRQGEYTALVDSAMQKMQNMEPLTEPERQAAAIEAAGGKPRAKFLEELVVPYAYRNTRNIETYRAKPQPRAAATVITAPSGPVDRFGVDRVQTATGSYALPSTYYGDEPAVYARDGTAKPVTLKGSQFSGVNIQVEGQKLSLLGNYNEPQNLVLKAPILALVGRNGSIFTPSKEEYGKDKEALTNWYTSALKKDPSYRLTYVVQATPEKGLNNMGDPQAMFDAVKASYEGGAVDPEIAKIRAQFGTEKRKPSDPEIRDKVNKMFAKQSATYYIPYEGANKRKLDIATAGARNLSYASQSKAMEAERQRILALSKQKAPAKATGVQWGTPAAKPAAKPATPTYKPAGTKKTGVQW